MTLTAKEYRPRRPQDSDYYSCVEDYFEPFMQIYDDRFSRDYGFWRPYIEKVIDKNFLFVRGSIRNVDLYVKKILTTKCGVLYR